jgi:outer membrane biogenesis lipoprotein LolB
MKLGFLILGISACLFLTGCKTEAEKKAERVKHLASLTCESSKKGRDKEELQAIGDACFRGGSYTKSKHMAW